MQFEGRTCLAIFAAAGNKSELDVNGRINSIKIYSSAVGGIPFIVYFSFQPFIHQ
jgi:hypothetical protein